MTQPKGEYYLTDMVGLAVQDGLAVEALTIQDVTEVQGINNRVHLARCESDHARAPRRTADARRRDPRRPGHHLRGGHGKRGS